MLSFILLVISILTQQTFTEEPEAIVGGQDAEPGEFPYQVALKINGYHECSGSIIGRTKILTAAHCVYNIAHPYTNLKIVTGTIDIREGQLHEVKSIRVYPGFSKKYGWVNDVAVITLSEPIQYDQYRAPIALADFEPVDGQPSTLAGWGRIITEGQFPYTLQKINQIVMSFQKCQRYYNIYNIYNIYYNFYLTQSNLCANNRYGIGTCKGDSGSPLVSYGKQIGILSWNTDNCAVGIPDVHMNVYHYRNFILSSLKDV